MSTHQRLGSAALAAGRLRSAEADGSLDELCRSHGIGALVVFGSAATSEPEPGDVDLAYLPGRTTHALALLDDLVALLGDERVDLVNLATAGPVVSHRALTGRGLYEDDPGRLARMRDRAIRQYHDTAWVRRARAQVLTR